MPQRSDGLDLRSATCGHWVTVGIEVSSGRRTWLAGKSSIWSCWFNGKIIHDWRISNCMIDYRRLIMMYTSPEGLTWLCRPGRLEICTHVLQWTITSHRAEKHALTQIKMHLIAFACSKQGRKNTNISGLFITYSCLATSFGHTQQKASELSVDQVRFLNLFVQVVFCCKSPVGTRLSCLWYSFWYH